MTCPACKGTGIKAFCVPGTTLVTATCRCWDCSGTGEVDPSTDKETP